MKINAAQFVCIINLQSAWHRGYRDIDVISNTADYSAKLTANFNYFAINRRARPRGLSVVARTIRALTQLRFGPGRGIGDERRRFSTKAFRARGGWPLETGRMRFSVRS